MVAEFAQSGRVLKKRCIYHNRVQIVGVGQAMRLKLSIKVFDDLFNFREIGVIAEKYTIVVVVVDVSEANAIAKLGVTVVGLVVDLPE